MKKKSFDLTALGEILIDFTSRGKSEQGLTMFEQNPGGAPANVVCAAAKLGLNTAFIGKIGRDMHGAFLEKILQDLKVNTDGVIKTSDAFTTLAFVELNESGERSFSFARKPGADTCLKVDEVNHEIIKQSKILHIGSLSLTDEPARSATFSAIKAARDSNIIISYDPNYRSMLWKSEEEATLRIRSVLPYADIIKISDEEMSLVTGFNNELESSKALLDMGISCVLITLGAKGAFVRVADGYSYIDSFKVKTVDTTGAGDAFLGGFLYKLSKSRMKPQELNLDTAIIFAGFANKVAGICVSKRGAIPAMPNLSVLKTKISTKEY